MSGPSLPFSEEIHATKYRQKGESFEEAMTRIAVGLTEDNAHFLAFRDILEDMRFMPGGRIQAAIGAPKTVTPYNCFVSGAILDSFVDGDGNIMQRATEAAATMRMGGGIGYDFSTLRPRGALIRKLGSQASGPLSFMDIYDSICRCVASSGHRRGAQMGVLRVDHPDIKEFISAKQNTDRLTGFNISIAVTDEFMKAVQRGSSFDLKFGGEVYETIDAQELWEGIMRTTWDWAEPGVLFIDTINQMNNLYYCEKIAATNPCGEQPLPPFGACLLGSFNLVRYITWGSAGSRVFNWGLFEKDIYPVVAAMDRVPDVATYPLEAQRQEALLKRRMGLGITGLANAAEALGYAYGSQEFLNFETCVLQLLANGAYAASARLAGERGSFPLYSQEHFLKSKFVNSTLERDVIRDIGRFGIRNSHLTSIAPTGTISLSADNISSGIEPVFSLGYDRTVKTFEGDRVERVDDYGLRVFGVEGKVSSRVTAREHVDVLVVAAQNVDSAVSKTCNVSPDMPWDDFKRIYMSAWELGAKGCTTFNSGGKRFGILVAAEEPKGEPQETEEPELVGAACMIDPATGRRSCE